MGGDCYTYACCHKGCQSVIHLHHDVDAKLRRTHETFFCSAGHGQSFSGKTVAEKKIEGLERRVERYNEMWSEALDQRDEWRLQAKTCPFECGYRVLRKSKRENIALALSFHLVEAHGAQVESTLVEEMVGG